MLKKSRGQSTRGGHPARVLGEVLTTPHCKKFVCYKTFHEVPNLGGGAVVNAVMNLRVP